MAEIDYLEETLTNQTGFSYSMLLKDFIPSPAVSEYVQLYRIVHLVFEKNQALPFKAYPPRPEHCLAFYPYDTEKVEFAESGKQVHSLPVALFGQQTGVTNRFVGRVFLVFQIIFHPGALYRITGIPAFELNNEYLDAELVFSSGLKLINEQLYHAKSYPAMISIANNFVQQLISRVKKEHHPVDKISQLLIAQKGNLPVSYLAKHSFLSAKQFERKFKERAGINPKLFARVARFDKAFRLKNLYPHYDWLRIALECNYHDYQHLVKDYKDFTNMTPTAFHEIENKAPERNFGLTEVYTNTAL